MTGKSFSSSSLGLWLPREETGPLGEREIVPSRLEFVSYETLTQRLHANLFLQSWLLRGLVAFIFLPPRKSLVQGRVSIKVGGLPGLKKLHYISQKWTFNVITKEFHTV